MNTLVIRRRYPIASAVVVVAVVTLLGMMVVSAVDAAPVETDVPIEDRAQMQQAECYAAGGAPFSHYVFDEAGLATAKVICEARGWVCDNTRTTEDCYTVGRFAQLTPAVVPDQRPDTAAPSENPMENVPVVDDRVAPPGGVAEDPAADDEKVASQAAADQVDSCEALGGTATVNAQSPTATFDVQCAGGMLDGMTCDGTICDYVAAAPASPGEDARVPPPGGIEDPTGPTTSEITFVRVDSMADLEDALLAENPDDADTVVIAKQSDSPMTDNATGQVLACRAAGGTETVTEVRSNAGLKYVDVFCNGGLLDGMACFNADSYTICFFRTVLPENPRVPPAAGVGVLAEDVPTATPTATEAQPTATATPAVSPTVSPTDTPVAPTPTAKVIVEVTATPASDPPPPPRNDNAAPPPVEAEDPTQPEPTPTGAPLL